MSSCALLHSIDSDVHWHSQRSPMYQSIGSSGNSDSSTNKDVTGDVELKEDSFLRVYAIFFRLTATCLLVVVCASVLFLILDTSLSNANSIVHLFLRMYGLIFMSLAFMCEMEWVEAIRQSTIFQNWLFRGMFYSFLGLFTYVEYQREDRAVVRYGWVMDSIAVTLAVLGVVYTVMVR